MCGRYALALRPDQVRAYLEAEGMDVYGELDDDGDHAPPRRSYNFAPGYHGVVYRADVPDYGAGPRQHKSTQEAEEEDPIEVEPDVSTDPQVTRYKMQSMKWGLIPFWTKRNPDYGSLLRTINCRDDSLIENRGMWTTMKQRKRCIVVAQGFYEWLKKNNGKERIPHFIKRKDGKLMCMAGLWDCVQYEGSDEKLYTYTIITTSSNKQLDFLHDRMPVILENGSENLRTWLDPKRYTWTSELQSLLKPFQGELEIYAVSKEVGKVGNNSPTFIVPIDSTENKNNIANFFNNPTSSKHKSKDTKEVERKVSEGESSDDANIKHEEGEDRKTVCHSGTEDNAPLPIPKSSGQGQKREHIDDVAEDEPPKKAVKAEKSPSKFKALSPAKPARKTRSATSNGTSPAKPVVKDKGSQKITSFFSK